MNQDQAMSVVRAVLQVIGTFLVTYGASAGITEQMWTTVTGGIMVIAPVIWGILAHTNANTVAAAAKIPEVASVQVTNTPAGLALKDAAGSKPDALVMVAR